LEQQLLLKEMRIGRRSQELPSWTGVVSVIKVTRGDGLGGGTASSQGEEGGGGDGKQVAKVGTWVKK